jgi:hypothetical protein
LPRHTGEQQFNAREFIEFAGLLVFECPEAHSLTITVKK